MTCFKFEFVLRIKFDPAIWPMLNNTNIEISLFELLVPLTGQCIETCDARQIEVNTSVVTFS